MLHHEVQDALIEEHSVLDGAGPSQYGGPGALTPVSMGGHILAPPASFGDHRPDLLLVELWEGFQALARYVEWCRWRKP